MVQSTVRLVQSFLNPGDVYDDSPRQALPYILTSKTSANIVGNAFTVSDGAGMAEIGASGDNGTFAGILINSKAYVNQGTDAGGTLAPTLQVTQYTEAELMTKGRVVVALTTTANVIGNLVYFNDATGAIGTGAAVPASHTQIMGARLEPFEGTAAGLAVINLTQ